jgi:hypothetical protein
MSVTDLLQLARRLADRAEADEILGVDTVPVKRAVLADAAEALQWAYGAVQDRPSPDEEAERTITDLCRVIRWFYELSRADVDVPGVIPAELATSARWLWDPSVDDPSLGRALEESELVVPVAALHEAVEADPVAPVD